MDETATITAFDRATLVGLLENYREQEATNTRAFESAREALLMVRGCRLAVEAQIAHLDQQAAVAGIVSPEPTPLNGRAKGG